LQEKVKELEQEVSSLAITNQQWANITEQAEAKVKELEENNETLQNNVKELVTLLDVSDKQMDKTVAELEQAEAKVKGLEGDLARKIKIGVEALDDAQKWITEEINRAEQAEAREKKLERRNIELQTKALDAVAIMQGKLDDVRDRERVLREALSDVVSITNNADFNDNKKVSLISQRAEQTLNTKE
jgi:predicted amino acid dehydrogenase